MTTNKRKDRAYSYAVILAFVLLATIARASNPQETVLYSFQGTPDGEFPTGRLAQDSAGNLYGVATNGGTPGNGCGGQCGIVFELSPLTSQNGSWSEAVIYDFQGVNVGDGDYPLGGPIWGVDKRLYGTTGYGGGGNCVLLGGHVGCGTVYELIPPSTSSGAWTESVIYSFQGGTDGYFPTGELVSDNQGNLYGATYFGGGLGQCDAGIYPHCGTVFELSPPSTNGGVWTEKVLYSFVNGPNGAQPNGSLVFDTKGGAIRHHPIRWNAGLYQYLWEGVRSRLQVNAARYGKWTLGRDCDSLF
jgi:hypothetical protein